MKTLRKQAEKAKADAVVKFRASQSFIDACAVYYGEGFNNCLKQVGSVYPDLDLSKIFMDDTVPTTPIGDDTVNEEFDDSAHTKKQVPKDDGVVIAQPIPDGVVTLSVPSTKDPPIKDTKNPSTQDAQNPSA